MRVKNEVCFGRLTVVGSLNIDRVWRLDSLPAPGETVLATETRVEFGGKGANQAVASARQGVRTELIGAVGNDDDGRLYCKRLRSENVDVSSIVIRSDVSTGSAHVYVDSKGENLIAVALGANATLDYSSIKAPLDRALEKSQVLVVQLESPLEVVCKCLVAAARCDVRTVLNASPFNSKFPWGRTPVDTVIVNENECLKAFDVSSEWLLRSAPLRGDQFLKTHGLKHLVVTRGAEATIYVSVGGVLTVPTLAVKPVDTVGAGDTFAGVLAAKLAARLDWPQAIRKANIAAALSTLAVGAQSAMPTRKALENVS